MRFNPFKDSQYTTNMTNRFTHQPINFSEKEFRYIEEDFNSVAGSDGHIDINEFRDKMGILGSKLTERFSDRIYRSLDLDQDGYINLNDYVEYMDILKNGDFYSRSYLSFKIIDTYNKQYITQPDLLVFWHDFLLTWSSITNVSMSKAMSARVAKCVNSLFKRMRATRNTDKMDFKYFYQVLCVENEFIPAFDYIKEGPSVGDLQDYYHQEYIQLAKAVQIVYNKTNFQTFAQQQPMSSTHRILSPRQPAAFILPDIQHDLGLMLNRVHQVIPKSIDGYQLLPDYLPNSHKFTNVTAWSPQLRRQQGGKIVFFGDSNWNLTLNMMIGIEMSVKAASYEEVEGQPPIDFYQKYFFELIPRRFGSENNPKILKFIDYAPQTFSSIRRMFGITNDSYIKSLGPDRLLASIVIGQISSMTSMISSGKSGSIFYISNDGQYLLKTIHKKEFYLLKKILRDYYHYLVMYPETLICRFYGLHEIVEHRGGCKGKRKYYFLIMGNVFNVNEKITQKFDLKGSTRGRYTQPKKQGPIIKKDLNFMQRPPVQLHPEDSKKLLWQIQNDINFLRTHNSIDYSLIVGIVSPKDQQQQFHKHTIQLLADTQKGKKQKKPLSTKIYHSRSSTQRYIFGIIDYLTPYSKRKHLEACCNQTFHKSQASCLPPNQYGQRMWNFLSGRVFS